MQVAVAMRGGAGAKIIDGAGMARVHEPQRQARYLGRTAGFGEQPERIGRTRLWLLPSPSPTAGWDTHWWRMLANEGI
jgi:hypothetical protein